MPTPPNRPLWTRLFPTFSERHTYQLVASLLPLLAPSIATMGMGGTVSSSSDLTSLTQSNDTINLHNNNDNSNNNDNNNNGHDISPSSGSLPSSAASCECHHKSYHYTGPGHYVVFGSTLKSCAICLEDYRDGDRLRILDPCGHGFHLDCVDKWFDTPSNNNIPYFPCPVCKAPVIINSLPYTNSTTDNESVNTNRNSSSLSSSRNNTDNSRQTYSNTQLIDLSVHQSWVEWFSEMWKVIEMGNAPTFRRRV